MLAKGASEPEARDVIQNVSLAVYEALTGVMIDPGWSRHGEAAPIESGIVNPPAPLPSPAENTEKYVESTKPTKPPLYEKSSPESRYNSPAGGAEKRGENTKPSKFTSDKKSSWESWYDVPDSPFEFASPLDPYAWEPVDPEVFAPMFEEENTYQEEETTES